MTTSPDPLAFERWTRLAETGAHAAALDEVLKYLRASPEDGRALNDAGTLLWTLGRLDEAADYLKRAAGLLTDERGQVLWNLAEVYLAANRPADAMGLFDGLAAQGLMTADLANRTAVGFLDRGDAAGGIEAILCSLRVSPQQALLRPIYERARALRPKVAILCEAPDAKFLTDIHRFLNERFDVRVAVGQSESQTLDLLRWCDIAWLEWCTPQAALASKSPKTCRTIVRLHRFEAFNPWPAEVRWENIDALVTVGNTAVLERLRRTVPNIEMRTRIVGIPNGVNLERFAFTERPRGKNLACVAHINFWKQQALLLHAFHKLHTIDPGYRLFFAGPLQDDGMLAAYLNLLVEELGLDDSVFFQGQQNDVAAWLEDKHYLVSGSLVEGHPVNVLEGMARGLKPVVHVFPGARDLFPGEYLWRTVDEFCERILAPAYEPAKYRDFVAGRYSLAGQLAKINELFLEFEKHPVAKVAAPAGEAVAVGTGEAK
jgi:glycosyltransferase involved in cell wall biosynthesis